MKTSEGLITMKNWFLAGLFMAAIILMGVWASYSVFPSTEQTSQSISPADPSEPSPYSLKWGALLGQVVDQDGNGIPDAIVTFTSSLGRDCTGAPTEQPPAWHNQSVRTDEKGEFAFLPELWQVNEEQKKQAINVKVEANGFLSRTVRIGLNYSDDTGQIDLFRNGRIEGVLIDPNGHPLANAPVTLSTYCAYKSPRESHGVSGAGNVLTDADGAFVFEKVPAGLHRIKFPGYAGRCDEPNAIPHKDYSALQVAKVEDGQVTAGVFLDLQQSRSVIKGKVVDQRNRPITGVNAVLQMVTTLYQEHGWTSSTDHLKSALTDAHGNYTLGRLPSGEYRLQAQYPYVKGKSYKAGDAVDIFLAGSQEVVFNLVLPRQDDTPEVPAHKRPMYEIPLPEDIGPRQMMVTDPRGNIIAGAVITFADKITIEDHKTHHKTVRDWSGQTITVDALGRFELPAGLQPADGQWVRCQTIIEAEGFEKRTVSLGYHHLNDERRIDLLPLREIRGRLVGARGRAVRGAVSLRENLTAHKHPGSSQSRHRHDEVQTGADGWFTYKNLPEGVYLIQYALGESVTGRNFLGGVIVTVQGDMPVQEVVIDTAQQVCALGGRVLDRDGQPVKGGYVRLLKSISWGYSHFGQATVFPEFYRSEPSGRDGRYRIGNIVPGVYEVEAVIEGSPRRTSQKRTLAIADGQAIEIDLRLNR